MFYHEIKERLFTSVSTRAEHYHWQQESMRSKLRKGSFKMLLSTV